MSQKIKFSQEQTKYLYDASGVKLRVKHKTANSSVNIPLTNTRDFEESEFFSTLTTDYIGNKVYENGKLKRVLTETGYIQDGHHYFYLKDHLGNNCVVVDESQNIIQHTTYYASGCFNTSQSTSQPYFYNGKEYDFMHGVDLYDYLARQFYSSIMRFTTPDPLAHKYYNISPYAYCNNNPVRFVDPTGMDWYEFDEDGNYSQKVKAEGTHRMMTKSTDKKGNVTYKFYDFNDPGADAKAIDNGAINKVEFLSDSKVEEMIDASGVKSSSTQSSRWSYAKNEGVGKMDYGHRGVESGLLNKSTFYVRENTAYYLGDIGNYLWGRGMAELGFELGTAKMGAHANNVLFGRGQGTSLYDFGPGTYGAPSFWDSPGDQRAIVNGYTNSPIGKIILEQARIRNKKARAKWNQNFKTSFSIY